jgi:hypothetical protein
MSSPPLRCWEAHYRGAAGEDYVAVVWADDRETAYDVARWTYERELRVPLSAIPREDISVAELAPGHGRVVAVVRTA